MTPQSTGLHNGLVGTRVVAGPYTLAANDLPPGQVGRGLSAVAGILWENTSPGGPTRLEVVQESWQIHDAATVGTEVTLTATVVGLRPRQVGPAGQGGQGGVEHDVRTRHQELRDAGGSLLLSGTVAELIPAAPATHSAAREAGTLAWGRELAGRLGDDPAFASATASWDGTIGLRSGSNEVHLRIYRGSVIDVTRRAPHGPTFVLAASPVTWAEILTGPRVEFVARQLRGDFEASGDPYEYLRLTKALALIVDSARAAVEAEDHEGGRS